jgi:hypothetical protein
MARQALSRPRLSPQGLTYSLSFDGAADRAQSAGNAGFTGTDSVSIMGSFKITKLTVASGGGLVFAGTLASPSAGAGPGIFCVDNNEMQGPFIYASNLKYYRFPVDEWLHVAVTYAGGTNGEFKIYIGGTLIYTGTITGAANDGPVAIGGVFVSGFGTYLYQKMKVAGFGIYTDVLTQTEIQQNAADQTFPTDNVVGIYRMTDGPGATQVTDSSGNGNHLVITGTPVWSASDLPVVTRQTASARQAASTRQPVV